MMDDIIRRLFDANNNVGSGDDTLQFSVPLLTTLVPTVAKGSRTPTFTRATTAMVSDWEGLLKTVLSGEARFKGARRVRNVLPEDVSTWNAVAATTITAGQTAPDGSSTAYRLTATGINAFCAYNSAVPTAGDVRVSTWIRRITGTGAIGIFDGSAGSGRTQIETALTSSWQRLAAPVKTLGGGGAAGIHLAVSGDAVDVWHGVWESVTGQSNQNPSEYVSVGVLSAPYHGANVDGVKYFDTQNGNTVASNVVTEATGAAISTSTLLGYLAEGARTNRVLQSNTFLTTWTDNSAAPTLNLTGPDGATSGWTLTDNSALAAESISQGSITLTAASYTASVYVKKTSGAQTSYPVLQVEDVGATKIALCTIDTTNGVATVWSAYTGYTVQASTATCESHNANWWRVSLTFTATATANWAISLFPAGTAVLNQATGILDVTDTGAAGFANAQIELGAFASTYIVTTTAVATRNADVLNYVRAGNVDDAQGTVYLEYSTSGATPVGSCRLFSGGAVTNGIFVVNAGQMAVSDATTACVASFTNRTTNKIAGKWGGSTEAIVVNGGTLVSDVFDGSMGLGTNIEIGSSVGASNAFACQRNVRVYNRALSDATLTVMTT